MARSNTEAKRQIDRWWLEQWKLLLPDLQKPGSLIRLAIFGILATGAAGGAVAAIRGLTQTDWGQTVYPGVDLPPSHQTSIETADPAILFALRELDTATATPRPTETKTPPPQPTKTEKPPTATKTATKTKLPPTPTPKPTREPTPFPPTSSPTAVGEASQKPPWMPEGSYSIDNGNHWSTPLLDYNPCPNLEPEYWVTMDIPYDPSRNFPWGQSRYVCTYGVNYGDWTAAAKLNYAPAP